VHTKGIQLLMQLVTGGTHGRHALKGLLEHFSFRVR
jgi:hypothetical protein